MGLDAAVSVMLCVFAVSALLADAERQRIEYVRAMRRCLLRMNDVLRYEQAPLPLLLRRIDMKATRQEKELSAVLHACADKLDRGAEQLLQVFIRESVKRGAYGVLGAEDREAFEWILAELGRSGLSEQMQLISQADERLRRREEILSKDARQRGRLIRTLGFSGGAALFLILI